VGGGDDNDNSGSDDDDDDDREVMANRPDIIIMKKQTRENVHTDRCGNTSGQECHARGSRKEYNTRVY